MVKTKYTKMIACMITVIMLVTMIIPGSWAATGGNKGTVYMSDNVLRLSDGHGLNFKTVYNHDLGIYETAYCIQHGTSLYSMTELRATDIDTHLGTGNINDQIRLALAYGFDSSEDISQTLSISSADGQKYAATQFIVWNILSGGYDNSFNRTAGWFDYADPDQNYYSQINSYVSSIEGRIRNAISARGGGVKVFGTAQESAASAYPHTDVWDDRSDADRNSIAENIIGFVTDIYDNMLSGSAGRTAEINYQVNLIFSGTMTAAELYDGIWHSAEAQNVIGSMSDTAYVTMLYRTLLNREPDQGGLSTHVARLASGVSRYSLIADFMGSSEWDEYRTALDILGGNVYYVFEYDLPAGASLAESAIVSNTTGEDVNFIRLSGNKWRVVLGGTGSVTFRLDLGLSSLPVVWLSSNGNYQEMVSVTGSYTDVRYVTFGARGEITYNPTSTPTPRPSHTPTPTPVPVTHSAVSVSLTKVGTALTNTHNETQSVEASDGHVITQTVTVFDGNRVNLRGASFVAVPRADVYRFEGDSSSVRRKLVYHSGDEIKLTGGTNGVYSLTGLYPGTYDIYETEAPDGYMVIQGKVATITVEDEANGYAHRSVVTGRTTSSSAVTISSSGKIVVNDTPVEVEIDVIKDMPIGTLTEDEYISALESVVFGLYTANRNEYFDSKVIRADTLVGLAAVKVEKDNNGSITGAHAVFDSEIPDGQYYIREIYAGDAVIGDDSIHRVTVDRSSAVDPGLCRISLRVQNQPKTGRLIVYKYDEWYQTYLEGAEFTVYREDGSVFGIMEWDETEKYYYIDAGYGEYTVIETAAPEGFILDDTRYEAAIINDGDVVYITDAGGIGVANSPYTFRLHINKVDESDTSRFLEGAGFEIFEDTNGSGEYEAGEDQPAVSFVDGEIVPVSVIETADETGYHHYEVSSPLRAGTYFVVETVCPAGYSMTDDNDGIYMIELGNKVYEEEGDLPPEDGGRAVIDLTIGNRCMGNIHITKIDEEYPESKLIGAVFTVYNDIDHNGLIDPEIDTAAGVMTEETEGEYYLRDLPYGDYLVEETVSPVNYVRREDVWAVSVTEDGKTYDISDNGFDGLWNRYERGSLRIIKVCSDDHIEGISFRIVGADLDGRPYDEVFVTDRYGMIVVEGLRAGVYTVSEVNNEAVSGYVLAEDSIVTIGNGTEEEVIMTNTERERIVTPTVTPTVTPSATPTVTVSPTPSPVPSDSPTSTPVPTKAQTPSDTPPPPGQTITNTGEGASICEKIGMIMIFITFILFTILLPVGILRRKDDRNG